MPRHINGDFIPSAEILFAENPEQRCPCLLLLDTSGSMEREHNGIRAIDGINEGLTLLKNSIAADPIASKRVELAVVTFGGEVVLQQDFVPVEYFSPSTLHPAGMTPLGGALQCAREILDMRKEVYKANGIPYYRPWVFLLTDGEPTDDGWEEEVRLIHEEEDNNKLVLFAIGVEPVSMETLGRIAHPKRPALKLLEQKNSFGELFKWLSSSMTAVSRSSETNGQIQLEIPSGWANLQTS